MVLRKRACQRVLELGLSLVSRSSALGQKRPTKSHETARTPIFSSFIFVDRF